MKFADKMLKQVQHDIKDCNVSFTGFPAITAAAQLEIFTPFPYF